MPNLVLWFFHSSNSKMGKTLYDEVSFLIRQSFWKMAKTKNRTVLQKVKLDQNK